MQTETVCVPVSPFALGLNREDMKALTRPAPARLLLQVATQWVSIAVLIALAQHVASVPVRALCMLLIATRQNALMVLMHEFSHYQLSRRHAALNDWIGDLFTAFPFFLTTFGFRRDHLQHHQHVSTQHDPNWVSFLKQERFVFPKPRRRIALEFFKCCVGYYTWSELRTYAVGSGMSVKLPLAVTLRQIAFLVVAALGLTYVHGWGLFLLYWIVPMATFLMAILYMRDIAGHFGVPPGKALRSRTVRARWVERLLFAPHGINFHAEHHLAPAVPGWRLALLHRRLAQNPAYREAAVLTQGYVGGVLMEVVA